MRRSILLALVLFSLSISSSSLRAQSPPCPTSYPDLPLITWIDGGCVPAILTINGNLCAVTICYCWRATSSTQHDIIVRSVTVNPGCPSLPNPMPVADVKKLFADAGDFLVKTNVLGLDCPRCGQGVDQQFRLVRGICYEVLQLSPTETAYVYCSGTGWCVRSISVCCDITGKPVITDNSSYELQGTCDTDCNVAPCD